MLAADLILKNANVITLDPEPLTAELVAIKGDKIVLVAGRESLESVIGAKTRIIDCRSKTVVPGFNDAHCHVFSNIRKLLSIDLSPSSVSSISDIKAVIHRQVQNTPPGKWLTGTDYSDFHLVEKRHPTRRDIDEVAPQHPVVLCHRGLHACVLNSRALSLAGITRETTESPGTLIDREPGTGEPSGLLYEMLGYIREKVMPPLSEEELNRGITLANQQYLSQGITSLQEATVVNNLGQWQKFRNFIDTGKLKSRVYMMPGIEALPQFQKEGLLTGSGDNQLRLGAAKVIPTEIDGQVYPPQPELNHKLLNIHQAGFQIAVHAVGSSTVEATIAALEYTHCQLPQVNRRHRIEHCSDCPPHLLERLAKLQLVIVTQPPFLYYSGERFLAEIAGDRQRWLYRTKSLIDSGLMVAGSSDSPVVPNNPLVGIYAAVTRRAESGQQLLPRECVSARQALELYAINAAYASFEDTIKGSITLGKLADIVVLSSDPIKSPPEQIKDIRVEMTIIGGKVVWEA